jgi:glycosyltransferase involved in cell wall biosynthesis
VNEATPPAVTVVVTFWNRAAYLAEAVESVLAQDVPPGDTFEVVLVDDGSDDDGPAVARRYSPPARVIRQTHRGFAAAANTGVRHARGEFVAFCDSDDVWLPGKLDAQLAAVRAGSDVVLGYVDEFLSPELDPESTRVRALRPRMPGYIPSCALVRRALFDELGPFDEALANGAWMNWYTRVRGAGLRETVVDQLVCRRRIHAANNWTAQARTGIDFVRALRPWVNRQRE